MFIHIQTSFDAYIYKYIFTCIYVYRYRYIYIYIYIHIYMYKNIDIYIYMYIYICTYIYIHILIHIYTYICIFICIYIYVYICIHIYIHIIHTHTHSHTRDRDVCRQMRARQTTLETKKKTNTLAEYSAPIVTVVCAGRSGLVRRNTSRIARGVPPPPSTWLSTWVSYSVGSVCDISWKPRW